MKNIRNFEQFNESISGWELVGQHSMGPNYPEQKLPVGLTTNDTEILFGMDGNFYTHDDWQDLYQQYLKKGGKPLEDFTQKNLDSVLGFLGNF